MYKKILLVKKEDIDKVSTHSRVETLSVSKSGIPCLWEAGGGFSNTGNAQIICDEQGRKKKAIYVQRRGPRACSEHALIPVREGNIVIRADHHRGDFVIEIYEVRESQTDFVTFELIKINEFSQGEWDKPLPDYLIDAVDASKRKALAYHCREPYFIKEKEE